MEDILRHSRTNLLALGLIAFLTTGCVSRTTQRRGPSPNPGEAQTVSLSDYIRGVYKLSSEAGKTDEQRALLLASDEALLPFMERLDQDPSDREARDRVVDGYMSQKLYWGAYDILTNAMSTNGPDPWVDSNLAVIWDAWGEYDLALQYGDRAVANGASDARMFETLGRIHLHRNEPDSAIVWYRRALEKSPNAAILANLGYAYMLDGNWPEARTSLEAAIAIDNSLSEAHNNLAVVLARTGHDDAALEQLNKAARPAVAMNNLGVLYLEENDLRSAEDAFRESLRLDPDYELARKNLREIITAAPPPTFLVLPRQEPVILTPPAIVQNSKRLAQAPYPVAPREPSGIFRADSSPETATAVSRTNSKAEAARPVVAGNVTVTEDVRVTDSVSVEGFSSASVSGPETRQSSWAQNFRQHGVAIAGLTGIVLAAGLLALRARRWAGTPPSKYTKV